jgi:hypothetical protein
MRRRILARRPSPAMVVAVVALVSSLTGGAVAATLITGGDIKNGSIAKKDLKKNSVNTKKVQNQTLIADDFAPGQLREGVQGIQGLKGDKGEKGEQGDRGPSDVYTVGDGDSPTSDPPLTKDVPAGTYFVTAQVVNYSAADTSENTLCTLSGGSDRSSVFGKLNNTDHTQETLVATMVTTFDAPGTITWSCSASNVTRGWTGLHAVRVGDRH